MKRVLPLVLFAGALMLFCVGAAAVGANVLLNRGNAGASVEVSVWKAPLTQVDNSRVGVADALEVLAGTADQTAVDDALAQGDWESAFAVVAYSPDLADTSRIGTLLTLGARYAGEKQNAKAAWAYQYAAMVAVISPMPSDITRAQTMLEAAQGLRAAGAMNAARRALDQAYLLAQYSSTLPRDSRARILAQVAQMYQQFGVANLAAQAKQKGADASSLTAEEAVSSTRRPYRVQAGNLPDDADLSAQTKSRITAARELIDELNLKPPTSNKDLPEDSVRALGDQLFAEDGLRSQYYDDQLKANGDTAVQVALLRDQIRWLALKLRAARGGFGVALVPEWEQDAQNIAKALNDAYDQLFQISEQQAGAPDTPVVADRQVEDVLRAEILMGRWGLYPNFDEGTLRSNLDDISQRLRDEQVPALRLDSYESNNQVNYLLLPDELVGQGEKALPK